jgi:hypothetical protein
VFKSAGLELLSVVDDDHRILVVVIVLETRHSDGSLSVISILPKPAWLGLFLQSQHLIQVRNRRYLNLLVKLRSSDSSY